MGENADGKCCCGSNSSHVACLDLTCFSHIINASVVLPSDSSVRPVPPTEKLGEAGGELLLPK